MRSIRPLRRTASRGFTLVEILIVVIILGILAAIVIPQFTSASTDARNNSTKSLMQTIRSQLELYKLQHADKYPTEDGSAAADWDWTLLVGKTNAEGTTDVADGPVVLGPYLQSTPVNPLNNNSTMASVATDAAAAGAAADGVGFIFSQESGKVWAVNATEDGLAAD